jgi:hypothetical protein
MAQVVSRRPLTAEARVRARVCPRRICAGQSGTGTGFSPSSSVSPCQYRSTAVVHTHTSPGGWTVGPLVAANQRRCVTPSTETKNNANRPPRKYNWVRSGEWGGQQEDSPLFNMYPGSGRSLADAQFRNYKDALSWWKIMLACPSNCGQVWTNFLLRPNT